MCFVAALETLPRTVIKAEGFIGLSELHLPKNNFNPHGCIILAFYTNIHLSDCYESELCQTKDNPLLWIKM